MTALSPTTSDTSSMSRFLPYLALLGGMISLAAGTSFAKGLFPVVGATGTVALRVGLSAVILLAVWRPWRMRLSHRDARAVALYGLVIGLMNLCFYLSLRTIPLGLALAIEFAGPLTLALLNARRLIHGLWVALAALGLGLLLPLKGGVDALDPTGVALAATAGVFWALYIVFGRRLGGVHAGQSVALGMSVAALTVVPFGVVHAGWALVSPPVLLAGLLVAVASSALPYSLEMLALRSIPKRTFGVVLSGEPAIGALAGLVVLHEQLSTQQWLAIAAILAASAGAILTTPPAAQAGSPDPDFREPPL